MNQNEIVPNVKALLDKISKEFEESCKHLIFEPVNDATLDRMKGGISKILDRFSSEAQSIDRYLVVTSDIQKNCILLTHTNDAPLWVKDIFRQMQGDKIQIDFTITKDGEIDGAVVYL